MGSADPTTKRAKSSNRGSKPGERRGGRQTGALNKSTKDVKAVASKYGPEAIDILANIMRTCEIPAARVAAARELLDRAYGKAPVSVDLSAKGDITIRMVDTWAKP